MLFRRGMVGFTRICDEMCFRRVRDKVQTERARFVACEKGSPQKNIALSLRGGERQRNVYLLLQVVSEELLKSRDIRNACHLAR